MLWDELFPKEDVACINAHRGRFLLLMVYEPFVTEYWVLVNALKQENVYLLDGLPLTENQMTNWSKEFGLDFMKIRNFASRWQVALAEKSDWRCFDIRNRMPAIRHFTEDDLEMTIRDTLHHWGPDGYIPILINQQATIKDISEQFRLIMADFSVNDLSKEMREFPTTAIPGNKLEKDDLEKLYLYSMQKMGPQEIAKHFLKIDDAKHFATRANTNYVGIQTLIEKFIDPDDHGQDFREQHPHTRMPATKEKKKRKKRKD